MIALSPYVLTKFGEVESTQPENQSVKMPHPPNLHGRNVLNRQQLSRTLVLFNFVELIFTFTETVQ